ncbi:MAG: putative sugar nucleotidyl transferase [Thaumarchaeota archaeon]|nr:putative sugar nucleotidyl transferase [Nitrososphaerota archaeon]
MKIRNSRLVICETSVRENFYPLTYTKLAADLILGTESLLRKIERKVSSSPSDLFVPKYLESVTKEIHPNSKINEQVSGRCVLVNSLISPTQDIWRFMDNALNDSSETLFHDSSGNLVFGQLDGASPSLARSIVRSKNPKIQFKQIPDDLINGGLLRYPWDLLSRNSEEISSEFLEKQPAVVSEKSSRFEVRGDKTVVPDSSDIERFVTIDSRRGPVIIGDNVQIQSFSHLSGPCFIGSGTKVKSAKIREGTSIGPNCRVSGEIEESIISEFSNKSHDGFLGHSVLGSWVNLGALTTNSNLKNTYGEIKSNLGRKSVGTGLMKFGAIFGDMAKTAIGTLVMAGRKIGVSSQIFGVTAEDVPSFTMYAKSLGAKSSEIRFESSIMTQRRMMERRGLSMSPSREALIRSVYKMTQSERAFQRVAKSRFKLL